MIEKRNNHALKCIQIETQLVYANLEAFVYILSGLGNIQSKVTSDVSETKMFTPPQTFVRLVTRRLEIVFDENFSTGRYLYSETRQSSLIKRCFSMAR